MEQEFDDDEFSDLYADVEVNASSAINLMHEKDGNGFAHGHGIVERVDKLGKTTINVGDEDCLDYRKNMVPNSVASSTILKAAGARWESNHHSTIMEKVQLVRSRTSKHSPASRPLSFDLEKYGSVYNSDSKEDNGQEVSECDLDETAETCDGVKKGNRVEPESSQSDQSQHSPAVSSFSSPSTAVDKEKNHKHSKRYESNSPSEKLESVTCDYHHSDKSFTRETRYRETDKHPVRKELKQHERSNYLKNSKTHFNEKDGFDMMNIHYGMRPESSFTYLGGFLPYSQLGPKYLDNNFWNIYPNFGFEAGWYNGHNMNAGGYFLERERPNINNVDQNNNRYDIQRRHSNLRATQFNKNGHNMQLRRKTTGRDLSPHTEDFMKGKFRRHGESTCSDRDRVDHRHHRYIPFDRREIKSHVRGKRRCESPLNLSNYSPQKENEDKYPKYIKKHIESGRSGNSNTVFDTSEYVRYYQGDDRRERRRHNHQSTNTYSSTTGSFKDHFDDNRFDRRKHHEHFEALHLDENEYNEPRSQDDVMFRSGGRSNQFHIIWRDTRSDDRHASDRVSDLPNDREENKCTYKMKRKRYSTNHFDWNPKFLDHHNQNLRCQDSVDPRLVDDKKCNLQSFRRNTEAEDEVYHSRFEESNDNQNLKDLNVLNPAMHVRAIEGKQCDKNRHDNLSHNQKDDFLDIEEGQINTEDIVEKSIEACEVVKQSNDVDYSEAALNGSRVEKIDDQRIKEIIAKMEKRRERFSEPITLKKDPEKSSKHLPGLVVETAEGKMGRPVRKRRWNGS